jgi:methylmalonyl-CoA epimerase
MIKKVDHIGILVKDMETSLKKYTSYLGLELKEVEEVEVENATNRLAFLPVGETNVELIHTTARSGFPADFLEQHGEGIHHIAFEVDDIDRIFDELRSRGVEFLWDQIIGGAHGSRIAFFKPEEFNGVYIELVQRH